MKKERLNNREFRSAGGITLKEKVKKNSKQNMSKKLVVILAETKQIATIKYPRDY